MLKGRTFLIPLLITGLWMAALTGCNLLSPTAEFPHSITISPASGTMVAYTTQRFTARSYNRNGEEIFFTPTSWPIYPTAEFGSVTSTGRDDDGRPFAVFEPRASGECELYCFYNDVQAFVTITAVATIDSITVTGEAYKIENGHNCWFTATVKDPYGNVINLVTPTWEVVPGSLGTFTESSLNRAKFVADSVNVGKGTVEAILGGVIGSREIEVSSEGF